MFRALETTKVHETSTRTAPVDGRAVNQTGRVDWVDTGKGISIILVVAMHATLGVEAVAGATSWMGDVVAFAAPFRMAAFFLLAGLFLSRTIDAPWRETLDRKVLHFVYFYVLWLTIQFGFKAPEMSARQGAAATIEAYFLAYAQPFGTLWFIYLLPIFYVVTKLARRVSPVAVGMVAAALALQPLHTGALVIDAFASKFVFFFIGYAAHARVFSLAESARAMPSAAIIFVGLWAGMNAAMVALGWAAMPGVSLVLGLAGAGAVVAVAVLVGTSGIGALLNTCGRHSIVIYLAFFLPMATVRTGLLKSGLVADVGTIALIVTVLAIAVPLLVHRAIAITGRGRFLFERPDWARLPPHGPATPRVAPAE